MRRDAPAGTRVCLISDMPRLESGHESGCGALVTRGALGALASDDADYVGDYRVLFDGISRMRYVGASHLSELVAAETIPARVAAEVTARKLEDLAVLIVTDVLVNRTNEGQRLQVAAYLEMLRHNPTALLKCKRELLGMPE